MLALQQFLRCYSNISQTVYKSPNLYNDAEGHTGWMLFIQTSVKFMSLLKMLQNIISSAIRPLVLLAIIPHNDSFSMGNQANLLLSHLLSAIKPLSSPFTLGTRATSFRWKLCPLRSWSHADLSKIPQNDSVFLCAMKPKAVSHQNEFVSDCLLIPTRQPWDYCQTGQPDVIWYPSLPCLLFDLLFLDSWIDVL